MISQKSSLIIVSNEIQRSRQTEISLFFSPLDAMREASLNDVASMELEEDSVSGRGKLHFRAKFVSDKVCRNRPSLSLRGIVAR